MPPPPHASRPSARDSGPRTLGAGYLFGVPVKDMGWFASLLMGCATGFLAFFASTFVAIISILFYNSAGHHALDYALSYSRIGLPIGVIVGSVALGYLGLLWVRRQVRRT